MVRVVGAVSLFLLASCSTMSSDISKEQSLDVVARELGYDDFTVDSFERASEEQRRLHEDTVASCMRQEGFDYTPQPTPLTKLPPLEEGETASGYAETHGWGITESIVNKLWGYDRSELPNATYRSSLGDGEKEAYDLALHGSDKNVGCWTTAVETVASSSKLSLARDKYGDALDDVSQRFWSDLRIATFHLEWSACMIERGFDYTSPSRMRVDLAERANEFSAPVNEFESALGEMLGYEIRAATASLACGVPPRVAGQPTVYVSVLSDLAYRFLQDNPEFIEQ